MSVSDLSLRRRLRKAEEAKTRHRVRYEFGLARQVHIAQRNDPVGADDLERTAHALRELDIRAYDGAEITADHLAELVERFSAYPAWLFPRASLRWLHRQNQRAKRK